MHEGTWLVMSQNRTLDKKPHQKVFITHHVSSELAHSVTRVADTCRGNRSPLGSKLRCLLLQHQLRWSVNLVKRNRTKTNCTLLFLFYFYFTFDNKYALRWSPTKTIKSHKIILICLSNIPQNISLSIHPMIFGIAFLITNLKKKNNMHFFFFFEIDYLLIPLIRLVENIYLHLHYIQLMILGIASIQT